MWREDDMKDDMKDDKKDGNGVYRKKKFAEQQHL